MSKRNQLRWASRILVIISGIVALVGLLADLTVCTVAGILVMVAALILSAVKSRCPFCHKPLRITPPVDGEEFCPYCGCKIE